MFNFHTFVNFPNLLLLLISDFTLLWSENILCMMLVPLKGLRFVLRPSTRSALERVRRPREGLRPVVGECSADVSHSGWFAGLPRSYISLLFCLGALSAIGSGQSQVSW